MRVTIFGTGYVGLVTGASFGFARLLMVFTGCLAVSSAMDSTMSSVPGT